jgi:hypothetical protein
MIPCDGVSDVEDGTEEGTALSRYVEKCCAHTSAPIRATRRVLGYELSNTLNNIRDLHLRRFF